MDEISEERRRSVKIVQIVFAALALFSLAAAVGVAMHGVEYGLPEHSVRTVALAFLFIGIVDTIVVFGWDSIAKRLYASERF